jgi:hypothetical protein
MKATRVTPSRALLVTLFGVLLSLETFASVEVEIEQEIMSTISTSIQSPPSSFPRLSGMDGEEAKAVLKNEYPSLLVQLIPENSIVTMDYREDRVRVFVDKDGKVVKVPMIG